MLTKYWRFWTLLFSIFIIFSTVSAYKAPIGFWKPTIFGIDSEQNISDPDGLYISSGIHLFEPVESYEGHPGLPLKLLIFGVYKVSHQIHVWSGGKSSSAAFAATYLDKIYLFSKLLICFIHLLTFYVFFYFARKFLSSDKAALLAVLAYATSFPILFFLTKISPETPFNLFLLMSYLMLWKFQDSMVEGRNRLATIYLFLTSLSCVLAVYTKLHFASALIPLLLLQIIFGKYSETSRITLKKRVLFSGAFTVISAVIFYLISLMMDWNYFFKKWFDYIPGRPSANLSHSVIHNYFEKIFLIVRAFLHEVITFPFSKYLPQPSLPGVFMQQEWLFLITACCGMFYFWKLSQGLQRSRLIWIVINLTALIPVIIHRFYWHSSWHYLFSLFPLAAVFFAKFLETKFLPKFDNNFFIGVLVIFVAHQASVTFVINARQTDANLYRQVIKPALRALRLVKQGELVAVVVPTQSRRASGKVFDSRFGINYRYYIDGAFLDYAPDDSPLMNALANLYVLVDCSDAKNFTLLKKLNVGAVVLRCNEEPMKGPFTIAEWTQ